MQFSKRQVFAVPSDEGEYAPEVVTVGIEGGLDVFSITVGVESGPEDAVYELWLLHSGGDIEEDADYFKHRSSTGGETWPLAGWYGVQVRVSSGGTDGNATVSVVAAS